MLLPGRKASLFRHNLADLFVRVLGGDERLAQEIKGIGEFQDTLPAQHPLRAFRDTVAETQSQAVVQSCGPDYQQALAVQAAQFEDKMQEQREQFMALLQQERQQWEEAVRSEQRARAALEEETRAAIEREREARETMVRLDGRTGPVLVRTAAIAAHVDPVRTFCGQLRDGRIRRPNDCMVVDAAEPDGDFFMPGTTYQLTMAGLYLCYLDAGLAPIGPRAFGREMRAEIDIVNVSKDRHGGTPIYLAL